MRDLEADRVPSQHRDRRHGRSACFRWPSAWRWGWLWPQRSAERLVQLRPLSPLLRWLKDNDPCYVELARVVHIGIGLTLAIAIGMAANQALGLGQPLAFPMFVALGTSTHLSFIAASSRMGELRDLARISVLTLGFVLLTTVMAPAPCPRGR